MMTRRHATLACAAALTSFAAENEKSKRVRLNRLPESAIQPQVAVDEHGTLHLVYYSGDAHHGDVFYARSKDSGATLSSPVRVNSQPGSAIAAVYWSGRGGQVGWGK